MPIKDELKKLKEVDIWSLMLFVLYKFQQIPEYSSISELAYILDQKSMLRLCEYFGGQVIKIPTIDQLEELLYAMLIYQYVDIEHMEVADAFELIQLDKTKEKSVKLCYKTLKTTLSNYSLTPRESL